jgi:hypothetical protein
MVNGELSPHEGEVEDEDENEDEDFARIFW